MENIKMRAKLVNDTTEVKMIINHPMETGRKKDDSGELIPAHFIQLLSAHLNDKPVLEMQWGTGISKNPYLTFYLKDAKIGDKIMVKWLDNLGKAGEGDVLVTAG